MEASEVAAKSIVVLIFDPTVLNPNEESGLKDILDELSKFYMAMPENSQVAVFLVNKGISQKPPLESETFGVDRSFDGSKHHKEELKVSFSKLRSLLTDAWRSAHYDDAVKRPTSCIASSIYAADQYFEAYIHDDKKYRFFLVLVSDMMESCDEWPVRINLEKGTSELDNLRQVSMIELSKVAKTIVVQVPNHFLVTPIESKALSTSWHSVFERAGVKPRDLIYSTNFPSEFDFGTR
jgi:hypothetical protein